MEQKSDTSSSRFLSAIIVFFIGIVAFFVGIVIGLVVLGWYVWPVQWTGATFDSLSLADQQDYLRSAIESYAYNPDATLAQQRYASLGDQKEKVLSDILANPGNIEKADVNKFVVVVKASPAPVTTSAAAVQTTSVTAPVTTSVTTTVTTPLTAPNAKPPVAAIASIISRMVKGANSMNICLAAGMILVVVLVILLILRRNKKSRKSKKQTIEPVETGDGGVFGGTTDLGQAGEPQPIEMKPTTDTALDTTTPEKTEIPAWLREPPSDSQQIQADTKIEAQNIELSDSDIKEITTSEFSTLESKPALSTDSSEFDQALKSSNAFIPDEPKKSDVKPEPVAQPIIQEATPAPTEAASIGQESQAETMAKFSRDIELTPGIDPEDAKKLRSIGITAPLLLLKKGAAPQGRQTIATGLGIDEMQVFKWVNYIDLLRVKGLTIEDAQMLRATGVDILVELATRDPENLLEKLVSSSQQTNPAYQIPSLAKVENWISQAHSLPRIVSYS